MKHMIVFFLLLEKPAVLSVGSGGWQLVSAFCSLLKLQQLFFSSSSQKILGFDLRSWLEFAGNLSVSCQFQCQDMFLLGSCKS